MEPERQKTELIDRIAARVRERVPPDRAALAERFVRQFYAGMPPDDVVGEEPDDLCGAALSLWGFAEERRPGAPEIRVEDPTPEAHGWKSPHTVVEIVNDDMPFLVDSVKGELEDAGAEVHLVIHPVLRVERDAAGRLTALHEPDEGPAAGLPESFMHVRVSAQPPERHGAIRESLARVLADVRTAVEDWAPMRERCLEIVADLAAAPPPLPAAEIAEGLDFLRWIDADHFTYLGYREYSFEGRGETAVARVLPESGLGLLREELYTVFDGLRNLGTLPPDVRQFVRQPSLLAISKSNRLATVHRRVPLDTVAIKCFDQEGRVTGERLFIGLFTSVAYSESPRTIPVLRQKVGNVVERAGFTPDSHDGRALLHILESYPRDELFQIGEDELLTIALGILHLQERQRIALFVRRDPFERFVSCLIYVPRDRYDTKLRQKFQEILAEAYRGRVTAFYTHLTDAALARLHVVVATTPGRIPAVDVDQVEERLAQAGRSWAERLGKALAAAHGEEEGARVASRYAGAFPPAYQDRFDERSAVLDVVRIEEALASGDLAMDLYRAPGAGAHEVSLEIYTAGQSVPLSDVLPMLEHMGLKVIDEIPYDVRPAGVAQPVAIRDFEMVCEGGREIDVAAVRDTFHEAFGRVWRGEMEDDGFNTLVLSAGLGSREVTLLRAYAKYLRQARIPWSQRYVETTLARNPEVGRLMVGLFLARFDPLAGEAGEARARELSAAIAERLDAVTDPDEDRILRRFLNLIDATLRTNYFQGAEGDAAGRPPGSLSLKLDSRRIDELPRPHPLYEVFVYSPRVEAVHLRGGKVARGGIRWSDRREDFRTEVLGLMKAQMVKNAVIVPVGSKGGFVVKRPPLGGSRQQVLDEGIACYETMMRGLLDLTDNLRDGRIVPPPDVVRRDGDDPYLVVAADKGTAAFSDIANGVAAEYGFWLDDAFASGGSAGYDHKKMAITSRGVWESVKRHFRELGKDVQQVDFTVVGVGDMSGDVFGNGMLMSEHIRLLAAFNHTHVFLDPDPDAAASFGERQRLFELPRSTWADYDPALLSPGGGVFERSLKSIPISPEVRRAFTIAEEQLAPSELIQRLLKAPVELLFFGGIGTFVKARAESHADVGDRANDAQRVDGAEVTALVVGEGANLGMTQRGRIEYAARGGRLNTDFIDNSAGVDCSDHEVNIKILLGDAERAGGITREERNELLRGMTEEVAALVLRDNYLQTQALSVTHSLGAHLLDRFARFIRALEKAGRLDRKIEYLPDDETLADRLKAGLGLTRPELAVLLSYSKVTLYDELLASSLPDDPYMREDLALYFPTPLGERFAAEIARHRLRREVIATAVTNSMVNRVGITFVHEAKEKTGMPADDVARAYVITREAFGMRALWGEIEALDNQVPAAVQAMLLLECGRQVERGTVWFLRQAGHPLDVGTEIEAYRSTLQELGGYLEDMLAATDREEITRTAAGFVQAGAPPDLARRIARRRFLVPVLDIARLARATGVPAGRVGQVYFRIGARFGFDWLRRAAGRLPTDNAWDKLAVSAILDDLFGHQGDLTLGVLSADRDGTPAEQAIEAWAGQRRALVARTDQLLTELQTVPTPNLAMLAVANRQLKSMGG